MPASTEPESAEPEFAVPASEVSSKQTVEPERPVAVASLPLSEVS